MLLVEDDPADAELALRAIGRSNLSSYVDVVTDGEAAFRVLTAAGTSLPKIVVLDLKLPKVDGLEVLHRMRADERTRQVPVVILSSSQEDRDIAECYRRGANSYVVKPIDPGQFEQAVSDLAHYWLRLNQRPV
jgi:CheY-like chemotaxis protein